MRPNQDTFRRFEIAHLDGDADIILHRASHRHDLAAIGIGGIDHLLHTRDIRGEGRDDHTTLRHGEDAIERLRDFALRWRYPWRFRTHTVRQQQQWVTATQVRPSSQHRWASYRLVYGQISSRSDTPPDPAGVVMPNATASGIEWAIWNGSIVNGPTV